MGASINRAGSYFDLSMELPESTINGLLAKRDPQAFEQVFKANFKNLHAYAFTMLKDSDAAEDVVQQVFLKLWDRADRLSFSGSMAAYLYRAVHNESLNYLKHSKIKSSHQLYVAYSMENKRENTSEKIITKELDNRFRDVLSELPEQCRTVFQMSRFEELKYREIAEKLNISVKTVENHMGKALKLMREKLAEYILMVLLFLNL